MGGKVSAADVIMAMIADFPSARVAFWDVTDRGSVATAFASPTAPKDVGGDADDDPDAAYLASRRFR